MDQPRDTAANQGQVSPGTGAGGTDFLSDVLRVQCRIAPAEAGAMVRLRGDAPPEVIASHPPLNGTAPAWLGRAVETLVRDSRAGERVRLMQIASPEGVRPVALLRVAGDPRAGADLGFGVYLLRAGEAGGDETDTTLSLERLDLSSTLIELFALRQRVELQAVELERRRRVLEVVAAVGAHETFDAAGLALVNAVAGAWRCARVTMGVRRGGGVGGMIRLGAMSHAEKVVRSTDTARLIEMAMEECLDQDEEISVPAVTDGAGTAGARFISRAAEQLSKQTASAVLSVPLRRGGESGAGEPFAVLTFERPLNEPFTAGEVEDARLLADLTAGLLAVMHERGRWIGATLAVEARRGARTVVGPRYTGAKIVAVLLVGFLLFITFVHGDRRVAATFRLEAARKRVIPAPFEGTIREVLVQPGQQVEAGAVLARLDDSDLRLKLAGAKADNAAALRKVSVAQREHREAEAQMARAEGDKAQAEVDLLEKLISRAAIVAPESGVVLVGDLARLLGAPVRAGDVLFEVAPLDAMRADLYVPERYSANLAPEQTGALAVAAYPDRRIGFVVERVDPVAERVDERVVIRARAKLDSSEPWMRPGMEGEARVVTGRASYASLWFGPVADWLRMKLWW
ncbi:MAG TPA: HlyD family efflux transporter periplasmic adaptor subunit [Phycisphaerales bacterium]|nr:HlyD family efflux transporter periplasmic adaptor subunit [Phycisphaerales bacterium]